MIDLRGSRFTSILPEHLRSRETEALAYAVGRQVEKLLVLADGVPFYAALSSASEAVLDCLAVELRTPAYSEALPLEVKRALIRGSLLAYAKMGTPAAVERTLSALFGAGRIEEWFDYGGEPHHFRVLVEKEGGVTGEAVEAFRRSLNGIKRLSSWLDEIRVESTLHMDAVLQTAAHTELDRRLELHPWVPRYLEAQGGVAAAGALEYARSLVIQPMRE